MKARLDKEKRNAPPVGEWGARQAMCITCNNSCDQAWNEIFHLFQGSNSRLKVACGMDKIGVSFQTWESLVLSEFSGFS